MVLAGEVCVAGVKIDKAGQLIDEPAEIIIKKKSSEYVSRGGLKLARALSVFDIDVSGLVCVDIGASTGGFTDCLLKHGAKKVYSIDVGYGQLDWSLRSDKKVVVIERTNIRNFDVKKITDKVDLVVIDVSFIGLEKVFPKIDEMFSIHSSKNIGMVVALIKPQFQVAKGKVEKGGVVRDEASRLDCIASIKDAAKKIGWKFIDVCESPITGPKGNVEYLACWHIKNE